MLTLDSEQDDEIEDIEIDSSSDEEMQPLQSQSNGADATAKSSVAPQSTNDPHQPLIRVERSQDTLKKEATDDTWYVFTLLATDIAKTEDANNGSSTSDSPKAMPA